jgi:hypothetical protein
MITLLVGHIVKHIMEIQSDAAPVGGKSAPSDLQKSQRRLIKMACMVGGLCLIQLGTNIWTSGTLATWSDASKLDLQCRFETYRYRDWNAYGFTYGEKVCEAGDVTWGLFDCAGACHYLPVLNKFTETDLQCEVGQASLDEVDANFNLSKQEFSGNKKGHYFCDCPCSKMVNPQAPPVR